MVLGALLAVGLLLGTAVQRDGKAPLVGAFFCAKSRYEYRVSVCRLHHTCRPNRPQARMAPAGRAAWLKANGTRVYFICYEEQLAAVPTDVKVQGLVNAPLPASWLAEQIPGGYVVNDSAGQSLACTSQRTMDEARRVATNIAKLPELLKQ